MVTEHFHRDEEAQRAGGPERDEPYKQDHEDDVLPDELFANGDTVDRGYKNIGGILGVHMTDFDPLMTGETWRIGFYSPTQGEYEIEKIWQASGDGCLYELPSTQVWCTGAEG